MNNIYKVDSTWTETHIDPFMKKMQSRIEGWCDLTFGVDNYYTNGYRYFFKFKEHAEMFVIRWL